MSHDAPLGPCTGTTLDIASSNEIACIDNVCEACGLRISVLEPLQALEPASAQASA